METDARQAPETAEQASSGSPAPAEVKGAPGDTGQGSVDVRPLAVLLARIKKTYNPVQIWLFGSRARGDAAWERLGPVRRRSR